jgi:carbon-monoxide dehydrogenase medium subunit
VKPSPFEYHAPSTVDEAVRLLRELGDGAKVIAGGQSLVPMLSLRLTYFDHLVDIGGIAELRGVRHEGDTTVVGATTVDSTIEHDAEIAARVPMLALATPFIGHFQIRNRGTVGGSIAHADPAAEYPAVALALDAEMEIASSSGRRTVAATDFFEGFWETAIASDELLVGVRFPVWRGRCGFAVEEFARRHGDFAIAGAVVGVQVDKDDRIARCAIGLFGLGPTPLRARAAEASAMAQGSGAVAAEIGQLAVGELVEVPSDLHGSDGYRRRVGAAMVRKAWNSAIEEATGG